MLQKAWPAPPHPVHDEASGGWIGCVAKRYGTTVDELADAADTRLSLIPQGSGWLAANLPASRLMQQLAELCRLSADDILVLRGPLPIGVASLNYCYRCLVLNSRDVFSPYEKKTRNGTSDPSCTEHSHWLGYVGAKDMSRSVICRDC